MALMKYRVNFGTHSVPNRNKKLDTDPTHFRAVAGDVVVLEEEHAVQFTKKLLGTDPKLTRLGPADLSTPEIIHATTAAAEPQESPNPLAAPETPTATTVVAPPAASAPVAPVAPTATPVVARPAVQPIPAKPTATA